MSAENTHPYPQKYSFQAPGPLPTITLPTIPSVDGVGVYANETLVPVAAKAVGAAMLLPLEVTMKAFGADVAIADDGAATLTVAGAAYTLSADGKTLTLGDKTITLHTAAAAVDGVLYASGQVFAETLDAKVWYSEALQMIVVSTGKYKNDDILRNIGASFWMNGQPYYEISYNKFDLSYQLDSDPDFNDGQYVNDCWCTPETTRWGAEQSLKELAEHGFKTIRVFCGHVNPDASEKEVNKFWAYSDLMYDMCDKYGIRMVVNLGMTGPEFLEGSYVDGKWTPCETFYDLMTNPECESRKNVHLFLEQYINRYKDRPAVLMWEVVNEAALEADIGGTTGTPWFSLLQVSEYYRDMAEHVKRLDPDRILTSGDSILRSAQWHLFKGVMAGQEGSDWTMDNEEDRLSAFWLLNKDLGALSVHGYGVGYANGNGCAHYRKTTGDKPEDAVITWELMLGEAKRLGIPLYNGECGGTMDENGNEVAVTNRSKEAAIGRKRYLDTLIDAGVQLTHWWTFRSDRYNCGMDLDSFTVTIDGTPETFAVIKEANEELQRRYVVNPLDAENTHILAGR